MAAPAYFDDALTTSTLALEEQRSGAGVYNPRDRGLGNIASASERWAVACMIFLQSGASSGNAACQALRKMGRKPLEYPVMAEFNEREDDNEIPTDETSELIASDKVEGTAVYGSDREKLGHIKNFMVDKRTGQVEYAVLVSGGLFGMGGDYYPLPWNTLTYDEDQGGYLVDIDSTRLAGGPHYGAADEPFASAGYGSEIDLYYGARSL